MALTRREFLKLSAGAAAATQLARLPFAEALSGRAPRLAQSGSTRRAPARRPTATSS